MGWLSGYEGYRKSHSVDGSSGGAQTDYTIKVIVHKGIGVDSGNDVYCEGFSQDDFGDLRFALEDGTPLDYWIEDGSLISGDQASFWVEIPSIPEDPDSVLIYVYFGSTTPLVTTSDIQNTFLFGDDFNDGSIDTSIWNLLQSGFTTVIEKTFLGQGVLEITCSGNFTEAQFDPGGVRSKVTFGPYNVAYICRYQKNKPVSKAFAAQMGFQDGTQWQSRLSTDADFFEPLTHPDLVTDYEERHWSIKTGGFGAYPLISDVGFWDQWRTFELLWDSTFTKLYYPFGTLMHTQSDTTKIPDAPCLAMAIGTTGKYSGTNYVYYDFVAVKKFVNPEPTNGIWGGIENNIPIPAVTYVPGIPEDSLFSVEEGVWAGLLRVAPGTGLQRDYVVQTFEVKRGASSSGGSFKVTFEDPNFNLKDHSRLTDLKHVWLGVQRGPYQNDWDGVYGRAWLLGGYIEKRYTEVQSSTRKTLTLEGYDYMVLTPGLIFGTPEDQRDYDEVDLGVVADDIATFLATYGFVKAPGAGFSSVTGSKIKKTYNRFNKISEILKELVEKTPTKYDWYIDYLKRIYFHERGLFSSGMIIDWTKVQKGSFVWGDCKDLITDVWATDGEIRCIPPDSFQWTLVKRDWIFEGVDVFEGKQVVDDYYDWILGTNSGLRKYVFSDASQAWGIITQCIMVPGQAVKAYYPASFFLEMDLREYTHVHFDIRKNPWTIGDIYLLILGSPSPTGSQGFIYYDWTSEVTGTPDNTWTAVTIRLPEFDIEGNVVNWNGWVKIDNPNLTAIGYVGLEFYPPPGQIVSNLSFARLFLSRACYASKSSGLYLPPRIKVISDKDLDTFREAYDRASYELDLFKDPLRYLTLTVDGDPGYLPSRYVLLNLLSPFSGVNRTINEVTHLIDETSKYLVSMSLSEKDVRPKIGLVPFGGQSQILRDLDERITTTGIGKLPLSPV